VSELAYTKILFHAKKYPYASVNGVLVGYTTGTGPDESSSSSSSTTTPPKKNIHITDYFPLFHGHTLAPMLEVAMTFIEEYCKRQNNNKGDKNNLEIVGYFHANELYDDTDVPSGSIAHRIGSKINQNCPNSVILLLDNRKINPDLKQFGVKVFVKQGDQTWQESSNYVNLEDGFSWANLKTHLQDGRYEKLIDFDNHLGDPSKDWLNSKILS